jgi:hypothetical protein
MRCAVAAIRRSRRAFEVASAGGDKRGGESGAQTTSLKTALDAIRRCLGERDKKRLLQEREVGADAAAGEQLGELPRLSSAEGNCLLRAKAALEGSERSRLALDRPASAAAACRSSSASRSESDPMPNHVERHHLS